MSFPSVAAVLKERGFDTSNIPQDQAEEVLFEAVKRDCPEAVAFLHAQAHGTGALWTQDPNSVLGKQLIRIHASDAVRDIVSRRACHGKPLVFFNCCSGAVGGGKPKTIGELARMQIACQAGPVAYADC